MKRQREGGSPRTSGASANPSPWTTWLSGTLASVALLLLDLPVTAFLRRFMLREASKRQRQHAPPLAEVPQAKPAANTTLRGDMSRSGQCCDAQTAVARLIKILRTTI